MYDSEYDELIRLAAGQAGYKPAFLDVPLEDMLDEPPLDDCLHNHGGKGSYFYAGFVDDSQPYWHVWHCVEDGCSSTMIVACSRWRDRGGTCECIM